MILLNKIDLIELVDFDRAFFYESVRALNPHAPLWLEAVVARALATDPGQRYEAYSEMLASSWANFRSKAQRKAEFLPASQMAWMVGLRLRSGRVTYG